MTGEIIMIKEPNIDYVIVGAVSMNLMLVPCGIGWLVHKSMSNDEIITFWTICGYYGQMTAYYVVTVIIGILIGVLLIVALGITFGAISGT